MSAEKPTTPDGDVPASSAADFWDGVEGQTKGEPEAEAHPATSQIRPEVEKSQRERVFSRPVRIVAGIALPALAIALAWVVVPILTGGDSKFRPRPAAGALPANGRKADKRESGRAWWVREPDASPRPRRRQTLEAPQAERRARLRREPSHLAPPPPGPPSQPPASGAPPASPTPAPEPNSPSPAPAEPKEEPGTRDGATESDEFGL